MTEYVNAPHGLDCGCLYCDYPHNGISQPLSSDERFNHADDVEETHIKSEQWEMD
jgi:hypothetical protein